jgi:hypothetical protein
MDTITERRRRPRLEMPSGLDRPEALGAVLAELGLRLKHSGVSWESRVVSNVSASRGSLAVVGKVRAFTVAEVTDALAKFEISTADRLALKFTLQRYGLLGA